MGGGPLQEDLCVKIYTIYELYPTFLKSRGWALAREGAFNRGLTVYTKNEVSRYKTKKKNI